MFILQLTGEQSGNWIEADHAGNILSQRELKDFLDCPKIDKTAILIVLLPGQTITMMQLKIPKMRASERLKAIPYILEEQIASDPEQINIAIGDENKAGLSSVAVFDKKQFEKQIQLLHSKDYYPQVILPDYLALPWEEETWSIGLINNNALVRTAFQAGFATDTDNLLLFLQLALNNSSTEKPKRLVVFQSDQIIDTSKWGILNLPIVEKQVENKFIFDIQKLENNFAINLLQGVNRPKLKSSGLKKNWMIAGTSCAALIIFLFFSNTAQWIYLSHQENNLNNQVSLAYQKIFPGSKHILEPHFRVSNLLSRLEKESSGGTFLHLLAMSGKALAQYSTIKIQSIQFSDGKLSIMVQTNQVLQLNALLSSLNQAGLLVQQHSQKIGKTTVNATLIIREQA